ncbi:MAG: hypothetical protein COA33_007895 [Fluviicola sp.]|nr:hypothetical protein [Fluviicola sp.]
MTKRKVKKAIYQSIFVEQKSHKETFDEFRGESDLTPDELADEVAKVPSRQKNEELLTLRIVFIISLCLVILLRIGGIYALTLTENLPIFVLLIALVFGLVIPAMGIFAAIKGRVELYYLTGIFLVVGTLRSFTKGLDTSNLLIIGAVLIPFFIAVILAFYIPKKMKTKFTKKVVSDTVDGQASKKLVYQFESMAPANDILDGGL